MAINAEGDFVGSVSGGCVENAVMDEALRVIQEGAARTLEFGVTDEMAWEVGLACGGRVEVLVESLENGDPHVGQLITAAQAHRAPVLVTHLNTSERHVLEPLHPPAGPSPSPPDVVRIARQAVREDRAISTGEGGASVLLRPFNPPARMIIVGAVHVAQALAPMAARSGLAVTVVDPRDSWITQFRFPGVATLAAWPTPAFAELKPDFRTAVVTLTHDPKVDDPALSAALASAAFYVGALGSKRTHAKRLDRLREGGLSPEALARIHAPVGLDLGARTPQEIAVSVLAQVIQELRRPSVDEGPTPS